MTSPMKVLVADDNRLARETIREWLAAWGMSAELAADGEEAWRRLQGRGAPRIAILDCSMPGADGLEVCRRLRQAGNDHYTYVILLTAHDGDEAIAAGFAAGADDYVLKESPPHVLRTRLTVARRIAAVQEELLLTRELLRQRARHDALTGLLDRRAGEEEIERELHRAARGGAAFGLVLLEVDGFGSLDATWGHPAGDRVLAGVADVLRGVVRAEDVVMRWGAQELLALLPQVEIEGAVTAAERIRRAIGEAPFPVPHGTLRATASLGVAVVPVGGRAKNELLATLDAALYRAKVSSGDCVIAEPAKNPAEQEGRQMLAVVLETDGRWAAA